MYRLAEVWGSGTKHLITHTISSRVACETSHLARAIDGEELLTRRGNRERENYQAAEYPFPETLDIT